ncbi:toll/interleukin-1 receptor domain-containing protein [Streptomyces sp. NPDC058682]|uniref:toll/interleukin-1 receptor domain-containing protein n=1 Tax=Streptomyces sp. NPDC058682 TaxID=3346596 RepID=UPI0036639A06
MEPVHAFCAYSRVDEKLKQDTLIALSPLERLGLLDTWNFRMVPAGREWEAELNVKLTSAELIILLISPNFINSDYCYGIEMAAALERHESGSARVVPVLLRDCLWSDLPFSHLQALPTNSKPVRSWQNRDAALADVARGIQAAIRDIRNPILAANGKLKIENRIGGEFMDSSGNPHNNFFDVAASGDLHVSAEDEPRFAVESVRLCERIMRTISYREDDWWPSVDGRTYLREQRNLLERNGVIERIFIVPSDAPGGLSALAETLNQQVRDGVDVFYVHESQVPAGYLSWIQDFILYDERLLRVSISVPDQGILGRPAEVYTSPDMIRRGLQWFSGLKAISARWVQQ